MIKKEYICNDHGKYLAEPFIYRGKVKSIKPPCPICSENIIKKKKEDVYQKKYIRFLEKIPLSNIPVKFSRLNFKDFDVTVSPSSENIYQTIFTYYKKFPKMMKRGTSLALFGKPGTGKTHLSCTLLDRLLFDGLNVFYTTAFEMLSNIKSTYNKTSKKSEAKIMFDYCSHDLLVIDEIGAYENTQKDLGLLFDIIDRRYRNNKPNVVISNLMENEFKDYVGERAFDRIRDAGGVILAFNWESYRK